MEGFAIASTIVKIFVLVVQVVRFSRIIFFTVLTFSTKWHILLATMVPPFFSLWRLKKEGLYKISSITTITVIKSQEQINIGKKQRNLG